MARTAKGQQDDLCSEVRTTRSRERVIRAGLVIFRPKYVNRVIRAVKTVTSRQEAAKSVTMGSATCSFGTAYIGCKSHDAHEADAAYDMRIMRLII